MAGTNGTPEKTQAPTTQAQPAALAAPDFRVPMAVMSQIINYIGQGTWTVVDPLMQALKQCAPIRPEQAPTPEAPTPPKGLPKVEDPES